MPAIIGVILGFIGKFLTDRLLFFVAVKALLIALFVVVLPIILKNFLIWIFEQIHAFMAIHLPADGMSAFIINLSGVGAYLGGCFKLPLCFSILMSAMLLRITLNFIPFIK